MDMDSAAVFLAGSILYALGFIVILIAFVVANNIIHKFWKSFGWRLIPEWMNENPRFITEDESKKPPYMEPTLKEVKNESQTKTDRTSGS